MSARSQNVVSAITLAALLAAGAAQADDILAEDGFEGTLGNWTATDGAGLFTWPGTGDNYASVGIGAAFVPRTYSYPKLTLTECLPLETKAYTNVSISFDWVAPGGSTVRYSVEYSSDGGTNWIILHTLRGTNAYPLPHVRYSNTLDHSSYTFTDNALFRIRGHAQTPAHRLHADQMLIIGSPTPPPIGMVLILK